MARCIHLHSRNRKIFEDQRCNQVNDPMQHFRDRIHIWCRCVGPPRLRLWPTSLSPRRPALRRREARKRPTGSGTRACGRPKASICQQHISPCCLPTHLHPNGTGNRNFHPSTHIPTTRGDPRIRRILARRHGHRRDASTADSISDDPNIRF